MEHNQMNNETETTARMFEDNHEVHCPFCDNIITVPKGTDVQDAVCKECCQCVGDFDFNKSTRILGDLTL